jgi:hypothetical protein
MEQFDGRRMMSGFGSMMIEQWMTVTWLLRRRLTGFALVSVASFELRSARRASDKAERCPAV